MLRYALEDVMNIMIVLLRPKVIKYQFSNTAELKAGGYERS